MKQSYLIRRIRVNDEKQLSVTVPSLLVENDVIVQEFLRQHVLYNCKIEFDYYPVKLNTCTPLMLRQNAPHYLHADLSELPSYGGMPTEVLNCIVIHPSSWVIDMNQTPDFDSLSEDAYYGLMFELFEQLPLSFCSVPLGVDFSDK